MDLLKLANSEAGRYLLEIKDKLPIVKVTPNSIHQFTGKLYRGKPLIQAKFWTFDKVSKELLVPLTKIQIASENKIIENKYRAFLHYSNLEPSHKYPNIFLATFTVGSGDGTVGTDGIGVAVWGDIHDAVTATAVDNASPRYLQAIKAAGIHYLERIFLPFNTAAIGDNDIVSALLYVKTGASVRGTGADAVVIQTTQAGTAGLVNNDFDNVGVALGSDVVFLAAATTWYSLILNATGIGFIVKDGWTKIGLRDKSNDVDDSPPPEALNDSQVNLSETGGSEPYLDVAYLVGGNPMLFGGGVTLG